MGLLLLTKPIGFIFRPISLLMKGDFRGLFSLLLGFALLGGLWVTALFSLSTPASATAIMTETGVALINPALGSMGVGPTLLAGIQADAALHPNDPVAIPGLKTDAIDLKKQDLVGLSFDQATRKIYGNVAKAYYADGPDAVFTVSMPSVSLLPDTHLDWLAALGLSATTLTAHGHAQTQQLMLWLWGAAALLGLLVLVLSKGWGRLYALAHALFTGAVPGLVLIGIVWFIWQRAPGVFGPFATLFNLVGAAFVPVYIGAGLAAIAVLVAGIIGSTVGKGAAAAARTVRRTPVPVGRPVQPAYRTPGGSSASVYSNMGGNMGGASAGASPASPAYGGRSYGQSQAYGDQPSAGQAYPQYGQALPDEQPGQNAYQGYGPYGGGQFGGQGQGQGAQPGSDGGAGAWPGDGSAYPQQGQQSRQRAYPDYRSYQQPDTSLYRE